MAEALANTAAEAPTQGTAAASRSDSSPLAYRITHLLVCTALRLLFRFKVTGATPFPARGPYIIVANHLNWLDAFALIVALPRDPRPHFIGWDGVLKAPKLAWLIRTSKAGFIAVPRDPAMRSRVRRDLHTRLCRHLESGDVLALFPEGSAGQVEGRLADFKPGFARLALATGVPILPIALSGTRTLWLRKTVRVVIGAPISPQGLEKDALLKHTQAVFSDLLPPYKEPGGPKLFYRKLTLLIPSLTNWTSSDF